MNSTESDLPIIVVSMTVMYFDFLFEYVKERIKVLNFLLRKLSVFSGIVSDTRELSYFKLLWFFPSKSFLLQSFLWLRYV